MLKCLEFLSVANVYKNSSTEIKSIQIFPKYSGVSTEGAGASPQKITKIDQKGQSVSNRTLRCL